MKIEERIENALKITLNELEKQMREKGMKYKVDQEIFINQIMKRARLK